jgi:hypothetical protein
MKITTDGSVEENKCFVAFQENWLEVAQMEEKTGNWSLPPQQMAQE